MELQLRDLDRDIDRIVGVAHAAILADRQERPSGGPEELTRDLTTLTAAPWLRFALLGGFEAG
ncbi:MAG: hypothetical protein M3332_17215 [Actinomycetota bacterium]|nr:hypothetical protein [Actinomycetota bacterium]